VGGAHGLRRCAALGVGVTVAAGDRSADAIVAAVRLVLGDPGYRTAARDFQAEMTALPGPERMVELLEALRPWPRADRRAGPRVTRRPP
jgi:UDP:flavonoid glycosyltransferase YjiC (YdhE family)